jgi:hypothetical protein
MANVDELIARARELQSLLTKRRRLARQLRAVEGDIKHCRKFLAVLKAAAEGRRPDIAPSRLTGGATGIVPADVERLKADPLGGTVFDLDDDDPKH